MINCSICFANPSTFSLLDSISLEYGYTCCWEWQQSLAFSRLSSFMFHSIYFISIEKMFEVHSCTPVHVELSSERTNAESTFWTLIYYRGTTTLRHLLRFRFTRSQSVMQHVWFVRCWTTCHCTLKPSKNVSRNPINSITYSSYHIFDPTTLHLINLRFPFFIFTLTFLSLFIPYKRYDKMIHV